MKQKETYTREEVIKMLRDMQKETVKTQGFFTGHVSQLWVIQDLLGTNIEALGGKSIEITIK